MSRGSQGLAWPQFANNCFASVDLATDRDYAVTVVGHFEGNYIIIDEVMQTRDTQFDHSTIRMKLIPGSNPPKYEPV